MCKKNFSFQKNIRNTQYINNIKGSDQESFSGSYLKVDLKNVSMIACVDSGEKFVGGLGVGVLFYFSYSILIILNELEVVPY